jgi:hypothetical protein
VRSMFADPPLLHPPLRHSLHRHPHPTWQWFKENRAVPSALYQRQNGSRLSSPSLFVVAV